MTPPSPQFPPTPARSVGPAGQSGRRFRFALRSAVLLLAVTATCLFAGLIASRASVRLDVTATREHRLSPRTAALLERVTEPHEIVVAGNLSGLDRLTAQRSRDVLDALTHASPHIRVTTIDTATAKGLEEYDALLLRQAELSREALERMAGQVDGAAESAAWLADALEALSPALLDAGQEARTAAAGEPGLAQLPAYFEQRAAVARVQAQDLRAGVENARAALDRSIGRAPIPAADDAARVLRPLLASAAEDAARLHGDLREVAGVEQLPEALRSACRSMLSSAEAIRDRAARAVASLDAVRYPPILAAARNLERAGGALVIGPPAAAEAGGKGGPLQAAPGLISINFEALFPARTPGADPAAAAPDQRFRAEELLGTAIASLNNPEAPIVVLVHGAPIRLAPNYTLVSLLRDRLRLRGMDLAEWAPALDPQPPALTELNPTGKRPVVYVSISTDASSADGATRMGRLASALEGIVADGKPLLLAALPSTLPSIGEADPMVSFLAPLGVRVDTARPVMRQYQTPQGRVVLPELLIADAAGAAAGGEAEEHPIASILRGLPTHLTWPVPIRVDEGAEATVTPLLAVAAGPETWAESDWVDFSRVPAEHRSRVANPPAPDSARDDRQGPWTLAAAVERRLPHRADPQRLVIVGSNGWFFDDITARTAGVVDGRTVHQAPGNLELFEAAVYWLAGQDELIAASPAARAVPLIPTLSADRLSAIRWLLVLGLPALTLLAGVAYRLLRG